MPSPERSLSMLPTLAVLVVVFGLAASFAALGGDTSGKQEEVENPFLKSARSETGEDSKPRVYSNEDLSRLYGGGSLDAPEPADTAAPTSAPAQPARPRTPPPAVPAADPLAEMMEQQRQQAARQDAIRDGERKVTEAQQRVADLEQRYLKVVNPLLARPKVEDDKAMEWQSMSAPERAEATKQALADAREQLRLSQDELRRLRR